MKINEYIEKLHAAVDGIKEALVKDFPLLRKLVYKLRGEKNAYSDYNL